MPLVIGFPRSFGRGLIEAGSSYTQQHERLDAGFRDLLVAASLKLCQGGGERKRYGNAFPRSFGRGLIEARRQGRMQELHDLLGRYRDRHEFLLL